MSETFQTHSYHGRTGLAVADLSHDVLVRLVERPEFPLRGDPVTPIKDGDGVLVVKANLDLKTGSVPIAYKRVHRTTLLKRLTQTVGPIRARQAFRAGHRLLEHGIATARPLAVVMPSRFDTTAPTWLAAEWVNDAVDLATYFSRNRQGDSSSGQREEAARVAVAVGRLIGRMHAAGFAHRDLKPQNLMVRCGRRPEDVEVIAIDLDGVRRVGRISTQRRWKNLSRLAIGDRGRGWPGLDRAVQGRFLAAYLDAAKFPLPFREAWRNLAAVTAARHARRAA